MKRVLDIVGSLLLGITFLLVLMVFVVLPFFGMSLSIVLSESMTPTLTMGGVIAIQKVDLLDLKVGDIISFRHPEIDHPITHRIIKKIDGVGFQTKGDAAEEPDPQIVEPDDVLGKVVFHIPGIGYLVQFLQTGTGFLLGIGLPAGVVLVLILKEIWSESKKTRLAKWRKKPSRFPAYLCLAIGLILIGMCWGIMIQNGQEESLATFATKSKEIGKPKYLSQKAVKNKGAFPLVICFSSKDEGVKFSSPYFWLSPGEQKQIEITGDCGEAVIESGVLLPLLPQEILYQFFKWDSWLGPLLIAFIPIFSLTLIIFFVLWKLLGKRLSLSEKAKIRRR